MTNVLVLNGSPRGEKGNTALLADAFLKGLKQGNDDVVIKKHTCKSMEVNNCRGCFGCWNKTPGQCIFKDDMTELLLDYVKADIIVYVTPLYYYGMTAILKKTIERLLPLNQPYMVTQNGEYTHPKRYDEKKHRHVLISTCGFPERHHFKNMREHFDILAGGTLDGAILCTGGEMLRITEANGLTEDYISAVEKAGVEFSGMGAFSAETSEKLEKGFVITESFVDMANMQWNVPGDQPPSAEIVHGESRNVKKIDGQAPVSEFADMNIRDYIAGMGRTFRPDAVKNLKSVLQFDFTDSGESYQLLIENGICRFSEGSAEPATTTIRVTTDVWKKIGQGTLNGASALMQGLYSVHGDFSIMMKMSEIFSDSKKDEPEKKAAKKGFLSGLPSMVWLSVISFLPWYLFWFSVDMHPLFATSASLGLSLLLVVYRKAYIELTPFDIGNTAFFGFMLLWFFFDPTRYSAQAGLISSLGMAVIWLGSLMTRAPLTAWYSKDSYSVEIAASSAFEKVNMLLTVFWVLIYLVQAGVRVMLPNNMGIVKLIIVYGLLIIAGIFTARFPDAYMSSLAAKNDKEKRV